MILTFSLPPFSVNKAYQRNMNYTQNARKYRAEFFKQLMLPSNQTAIKSIKTFNQFYASYTFLMPKERFYTKKGIISQNSNDLSNIEKLIQDFIFNKKYNGTKWLQNLEKNESKYYTIKEIRNLNTDDAFITHLESRKIASNEYKIIVEIRSI